MLRFSEPEFHPPNGLARQADPIREPEFFTNMGAVRIHGARADPETIGDIMIAFCPADEFKNLGSNIYLPTK